MTDLAEKIARVIAVSPLPSPNIGGDAAEARISALSTERDGALEEAEAEIARLRNALRFYRETAWRYCEADEEWVLTSDGVADKGAVAAAALETCILSSPPAVAEDVVERATRVIDPKAFSKDPLWVEAVCRERRNKAHRIAKALAAANLLRTDKEPV